MANGEDTFSGLVHRKDATSPSGCRPQARLLDERVMGLELGLAVQTASLSPLEYLSESYCYPFFARMSQVG